MAADEIDRPNTAIQALSFLSWSERTAEDRLQWPHLYDFVVMKPRKDLYSAIAAL
jgi:hypothetical protein